MAGLGERGERDHLASEVVGDIGDLVERDELGHEADSVRLARVDQAGGQQDVGSVPGSDKLDEASHLLVSDEYGQAGDGYSEAAVVGGDADVGGHGQLAAPADAEASDHAYGGLGHGFDGVHSAVESLGVHPGLG